MATISNGESGSSVRTKLNEIINKVEGVTSIDNDIDIVGTLTSDGLTVDGQGIFQTSTGASLLTLKSTDSSISGGESVQMDWVYGDTANSTSWRQVSRFAGSQFQWFSNIDDAGYNLRMNLYEGGDFALYEDTGTTPKLVWKAADERLGIGTDSPLSPLHINVGTDQNLRVLSASSTPTIGSLNDANSAYAALGYTGSQHEFRIGTSEAMRIDSSGNLLVGKTADNLTDAGQVFTTAGSSFTRSGGAACQFNRNTSDGEIVRLSKDGTTVGSIASRSGVVSTIILDPRTPTSSTGAGLGTTSAKIVPADTSGLTDGKSDLGDSGNRFKDLYLSGGVYLGGTGAANLLDDYEEGTWTPSFTNLTIGNGSVFGTYTKIGRSVTVIFGFDCGSTTSVGTLGDITGLPFAASNDYTGFIKVHGVAFDSGSRWYEAVAVLGNNNSNVLVPSTTNYNSSISATNPMTWTTNDTLVFTATYTTT